MALKSTIFKVELSVADMDRSVYEDFSLTLARHPSENDARMMIRLLAFMRYADPALVFGKGLSTDEEADLCIKDLTGSILRWILVGQPDERWLRKASGRAKEVIVFNYGARAADIWWDKNKAILEKLPNLSVIRVSEENTEALAALAQRNMHLQCLIQDNEMAISGAGRDEMLRIEPMLVFSATRR